MKNKDDYFVKNSFARLMQEMKLRGFSKTTIKSYLYYTKDFLNFARKSPKNINSSDIRRYLEKLISDKKSSSTINNAYSALLFYFQKIMKRKFFINIPRFKKEKKLPIVFTKEEVLKILKSVFNIKHKLILALLYSSGLRVSEVINIRVKDLDLTNNLLTVRQGKGKKDRVTIISSKVADVLKKYLKGCSGDDLVFKSTRGEKLSVRSVQKIFTQALKKAGLNKKTGCHSLRHSFATHLLEDGVDIRYIQELLGHKNLQTTQIYTKVTNLGIKNIKSPL